MKEELIKLIESKSPGAIPLYLVVRGSHAYGTNIETSDTDYAGVFIQSLDDILGMSYKDQINDDKNDTVIYEVRRFLELTGKNNPTILELLNTPEDCIIYKHPAFDMILEHKDEFLTKICANSFGGYAKEQISKAKGQNKKQNWEKEKVTRKTPLDFCYLHAGEKSISLVDYMSERGMDQKFCGISKIPHSKDVYALFYDRVPELMFPSKLSWFGYLINFIKLHTKYRGKEPLGFKGIAFEDSNDVRLSSIPTGSDFIGHISYNKDGYMQHCKDYKSYEEWISNRNNQRWVDVQSHNQKIDGKNMMHCRRLMDMAREIAEGKGIIVRRQNAQELIDIRKGKVDLQTLIDHVEKEIVEVDKIFRNSNLPNAVSPDLVETLLKKVRMSVYRESKINFILN